MSRIWMRSKVSHVVQPRPHQNQEEMSGPELIYSCSGPSAQEEGNRLL